MKIKNKIIFLLILIALIFGLVSCQYEQKPSKIIEFPQQSTITKSPSIKENNFGNLFLFKAITSTSIFYKDIAVVTVKYNQYTIPGKIYQCRIYYSFSDGEDLGFEDQSFIWKTIPPSHDYFSGNNINITFDSKKFLNQEKINFENTKPLFQRRNVKIKIYLNDGQGFQLVHSYEGDL